MKAKDLREKSLEDLKELEKTTLREVFQNRFKNFTNRLDDTSVINKSRRELARIKTLILQLTRKVTGGEAAAPAAPAAPKPAKKAAAKKAAAPKAAAAKPAAAPKAKATTKTAAKKAPKSEAK
jgi:large subunit ribosomal protein L29